MCAEKIGRSRASRPLTVLAAGVVVAALAVPVAGALPAVAAGISASSGFTPNVERVAISALAASTGLAPAQALERLRAQGQAKAVAEGLDRRLGARKAGFYLDPRSGRAVVNVLDGGSAAEVLATGATPRLVRYSTAELTSAASRLAALPAVASTAYGIDPTTNRVAVTIGKGADGPGVARLLAAVQAMGGQAIVRHTAGVLSKQVANGDEITTGQIICSAGFNVNKDGQNYLLDAGHCTQGLPDWTGIGPSIDSRFPDTDYGLIRNDSSDSSGTVDTYGAGTQQIAKAGSAGVGESVCKSGRTTFVTCGTVSAVDQTVNYSDGLGGVQTVHGLIQTNVHCDHGDSGGPLYDGQTGLGMVSGGDGVTDYFQPLSPVLAAYGVTLN